MSKTSKVITFKSIAKGVPNCGNFEIVEKELPELRDGEVLIKPLYLSVDPYMRGKMSGIETYTVPYKIGEPIYGDGYAEVIDSNNCASLHRGDFITGDHIPWAEFAVVNEGDVIRRDKRMDPEALLSICGMPGLTAYFGLFEVGKLKKGETILVSGGAGAVGSTVGQIAKLMGCNVVGIAGGKEKVNYMTRELGFDKGIDYKSVHNLESAIKEACPSLNLYWDNVGGETLDTSVKCLSNFGRVVQCGHIASYNLEHPPKGERLEFHVLSKRLRIEGFIVFDFGDRYEEAREKLYQWFEEGKLKKKVTIHRGFESIPDAFIGLFSGVNTGKLLVQLGDYQERR